MKYLLLLLAFLLLCSCSVKTPFGNVALDFNFKVEQTEGAIKSPEIEKEVMPLE